MNQEDDQVLHEFVAAVRAKLQDLSKRKGACLLCNELTNRWSVVIPSTGGGGDIGFGMPVDPAKTRIAYVPLCPRHDENDPEVLARARQSLAIVAQSWKN